MAGDAILATIILGAMVVLMWWLARVARNRMGVGAGTVSPGGLRVVGKRPLDQKSALYVIEIAGGRHILVGAGMDGTVTKVDDIAPEEYAAMVEEPKARPRLRVAGEGAGADIAEDDQPQAGSTPQFATVGESFSMLLGKARQARSRRRDGADGDSQDRRASGD